MKNCVRCGLPTMDTDIIFHNATSVCCCEWIDVSPTGFPPRRGDVDYVLDLICKMDHEGIREVARRLMEMMDAFDKTEKIK